MPRAKVKHEFQLYRGCIIEKLHKCNKNRLILKILTEKLEPLFLTASFFSKI